MVGSSKSKEYIGFINEEQIRSIRQDILGKDIGIAIDGTPFNGTVREVHLPHATNLCTSVVRLFFLRCYTRCASWSFGCLLRTPFVDFHCAFRIIRFNSLWHLMFAGFLTRC